MSVPYTLAIHGGAGTIAVGSPNEVIYHEALQQALAAGEAILAKGGSAVDAVLASVMELEDCPLFNAGRGSVYTAEGKHEMDASIMDGTTLAAGAVAGVSSVRNPVKLAQAVMDYSSHVMMIGEGAERFARERGLQCESAEYFVTNERLEQLYKVRQTEMGAVLDHDGAHANVLAFVHSDPIAPIQADEKLGTVGAVARDRQGYLAAATSTGGLTNKRPGRVGDSPIIGAGCYADNRTVAVSTTGTGEHFIRAVVAYDVAARMEYGQLSLEEAAQQTIERKLSKLGGKGGLIAIDYKGNVALPFNTTGMYRAWVCEGRQGVTAIGI